MNLHSDPNLPLSCQRSLFSIPDDVTYLNCAYMSPLSKEVIASGYDGMIQKGRPFEIFSNDFFEPVDRLKEEFAELIGADNPHRVAIIPSASYGFSIAANNLKVKPGKNLVILEEQFPSNAYCWQRLCDQQSLDLRIISPPKTNRERDWNQRILEAIDEKTVMVSMGILHWADGTIFDIQEIRNRTNKVGAKLILDGTQAIGAMPFNVASIQPDALICAAYKWLMGPYSIGLAYFGPTFDEGSPLEENWINRINSDDFQAQVGYQKEYRPYATRYDMGEKSNFIQLPMLRTALSQIKEWGVERIQLYCKSICSEQLIKLQRVGFEVAEQDYRANHLFGLRPPADFDWEGVKKLLVESKVHVSFRGSAIRISPHIYNTEKDIAKLSECLIQGLP